MATVNLGSIKFNWRGAYNNSTAYAVDDVVSSAGSSYVCILASTGNAVTNTTYWNVFAEGGDVATTLTTQGDILYRDGSGLQRLAAGTSGQYLETRGSGQNPQWSTVSTGAYSIAQFSDAGTLSQTTTNTANTSHRLGTNEITVTPSASTDLIELSMGMQVEGSTLGGYWGHGIQYSTTSGSYSTSTGSSNFLISTGEFSWSNGSSSNDNRYRYSTFQRILSASDWGLTAGTTYYLSAHAVTHSLSGNHSFAYNPTNRKNQNYFWLKRYTV